MTAPWPREPELRALWEGGCDADSFMDEALAALIDELCADCAVVFLGHSSGAASPWRGRDRRDVLPVDALEDVSRSLVERALSTGRAQHWDVASSAPRASARELGILAAVAAPIGTPARAALYVDFRRLRNLAHAERTDVIAQAADLFADVIAPTEFRPRESAVPADVAPPSLDALLTLPGLRALLPEISAAVQHPAPVLVLGETGTGKTLLAQSIAERIGRPPVVRAMLGTSQDLNTITSELFGHLPDAFTGATLRKGLVEQADGGVLVFDEVLNMPLAAQQLLLDFTQFGTYRPLGHKHKDPKRARVRLLTVTNGDLEGAVREGRFRADLYHRLAGTVIRVPPLRERRGDIPGLASILLPRIARGAPVRLSLAARRVLRAERLPWPGNVRQFELLLTRAVERLRARPGAVPHEITPEHLDPDVLTVAMEPESAPPPPADAERQAPFAARWQSLQMRRAQLEQEEAALLDEALAHHGGVLSKAARDLGVPRTTLASRMPPKASGG